jgi:hypothetical protein
MLTSLSAVPVTFVPPTATGSFTEMPPTGGPPTSTPPLVEPIRWGTYADPLGWTIDVPKDWETMTFAGGPEVPGYAYGASFFSGDPSVTPGGPFTASPKDGDVMVRVWHDDRDTFVADDSTFPLSMTDFQPAPGPVDQGNLPMRGDGLPFTIDILYTAGADVSSLSPTVMHMIESIRFDPWTWGERRNGFTAVDPPTDVDSTWPNIQGNVIALYAPDGDPRAVDFPDTCGEGQNMTIKQGSPVIECPDGTELRYDEIGNPDENNPPGYQEQVPTYVVVRAHDGHVLVQLP